MTDELNAKMYAFVTQQTANLNAEINKEVYSYEMVESDRERLLCQAKQLTITLAITDLCYCAHRLDGWQDWVRSCIEHCTANGISIIESQVKNEEQTDQVEGEE